MENSVSKISIITVCFNSEKTIGRTIESVLSQSLPPLEYIIVDGASTDKTLEIVHSYDEVFKEKGIAYRVVSEKDEGIYDAMNKGTALACGEITGLINSDDWYEKEALSVVWECYERTSFDFFWADLRMVREDGSSFIKRARNREYTTSRDWNHPTTFIRTSIYRDYHYRNETIHDDYELILRLKKAGFHIETENRVLANFSMNGTTHDKNIKNALKRCGIKYRIYRENGYSPFYFVECFGVELLKLIMG